MKITKEIKIGAVAIVAIVLLFFGLNFLKGFVVLSDDYQYVIEFKHIEGLSEATPIYADGYKVGVVRKIDFDFDNHTTIKVYADINKELRIPKGSEAEISSDLMGNIKINILMANNPRERIERGGVIPGVVNEGALGEVKKLVPVVQEMLPKLDSILVSVNTLLSDPAIARTLHNAEAVTANLKTTSEQVNQLMAQVNGQVPQLMTKAGTVLDNANGVMVNTGQLTSNLAQLDIAGTMAQVNQTLRDVNEFTTQLNSPNSTIGKFMHDSSVYDNMNRMMSHADSLVIDLKQNPKRYVHFSVFGRKN